MGVFARIGGTGRPPRDSGSAEKRRSQRVKCELLAQVRVAPAQPGSGTGAVNHGISQDISEGGIQIRAFRHIPERSNVLVELQGRDAVSSIRATGSVVWAARVETAGHWLLGIAFVDADDKTRSSIQRLAAA